MIIPRTSGALSSLPPDPRRWPCHPSLHQLCLHCSLGKDSFFLIKKWCREEDGRFVFTAFHFLPSSFQTPSPKMENKSLTLLTCIDFCFPPASTSSSPTQVGAVVKTPCLGWAWWELWAVDGYGEASQVPCLAQCLAQERFIQNKTPFSSSCLRVLGWTGRCVLGGGMGCPFIKKSE